MALGTVTVKTRGVTQSGDRYVVVEVQPTSGANYTANGETLPLATVFKGFRRRVLFASAVQKDEAAGSEFYIVDLTSESAPKLVAMASDGTEASASADLSAKRVRIFAIGR
jgi:hypothetical protein